MFNALQGHFSNRYFLRERTVSELVTSRLSKLSDIWEKMGLDRDALAVRHETVAKVVEKQLQEMIDEEEKWMARDSNSIEKLAVFWLENALRPLSDSVTCLHYSIPTFT